MQDIVFRSPTRGDGAAIYQLVKDIGGLDLNSPYAYLLMGEHFAGTSVLAERDGRFLGYIYGYLLPDQPDTVFVWQVGVAPAGRGEGLATRMLEALVDKPACRAVRYLDTTITPSNDASRALFRGFARKLGTQVETTELFSRGHFPADEAHESEDLFRIGPFDARSSTASV